MPQIETWSRLPAAVRAHLVECMHDHKISLEDLNQLRLWMEAKPQVPEGAWYKDFGSFKLCGEAAIRKHSCWRGRRPRGRSFNRAQPLNYQSCRALYGADIIGYLVGYANLTNTRSLALQTMPTTGRTVSNVSPSKGGQSDQAAGFAARSRRRSRCSRDEYRILI
jgi:hypothetical protein